MPDSPSDYELEAIKQIHAWKNPELGWFGKAMECINWPLDKAAEKVMDVDQIKWVLEKAVGGLVSLLNDIVQWSVRPNAILDVYRKMGFSGVDAPAKIATLDLEDVDKAIGCLAMKYKGAATLEGVTTGAVGLPGIPPDIVALIAMNLRAIGEYATYCGFDIRSQQERLFAMNILGMASSPRDAAKELAMAQLVRIAREVAKKRAWKELQRHTFVKIEQRVAKSLGVRLTKAKLAQVIPGIGAAVGGGFNAYYTSKVCDAAYFLYRERFLAAKYKDANIIEATVEPADAYDAGPGDEDENELGGLLVKRPT